MSYVPYEYPDVRRREFFCLWCLDAVTDDDVWNVVQTFGDRGKRFADDRNPGRYHFQLQNSKVLSGTGFDVVYEYNYGFVDICQGNKFYGLIEEPYVEKGFLQEWGRLPENAVWISNSKIDVSAYMAVEFVKRFNKKFPRTAFQHSFYEEDLYPDDNYQRFIAFGDDIQKARYFESMPPPPGFKYDL